MHTFLSCISLFRYTFLSYSVKDLVCNKFLYISTCNGVKPTKTCTSLFYGRLFYTYFLVLLSINGRRILWSCCIIWMFFFSSSSLLTSLVFSLLALNHLSNNYEESKMPGRIKFSRLQSSWRLFWRGVPVSNNLKLVSRALTT